MEKAAVVYFSRTDRTKTAADFIAQAAGAELFRIERKIPYPEDHDEVVKEFFAEQVANARPELKTNIDISEYGVVFVCYPNWGKTMPYPVYTFLENNDFTGKTVALLCTNGGGGMGLSIENAKALCPGAEFTKGLPILGMYVRSAKEYIEAWTRDMLSQE